MNIEFGKPTTWMSGGDMLGEQRVAVDGRCLKYAVLYTRSPYSILKELKEYVWIRIKKYNSDNFHGFPLDDTIDEDCWFTAQLQITDDFDYENAVKFYLEHEDEINAINTRSES